MPPYANASSSCEYVYFLAHHRINYKIYRKLSSRLRRGGEDKNTLFREDYTAKLAGGWDRVHAEDALVFGVLSFA